MIAVTGPHVDDARIAAAVAGAPYRAVRFGPREATLERRGDGAFVMRSGEPLGRYPDRSTERLVHWARVAPDRLFVAEREPSRGWRSLTYAATLACVRSVGQALLDRGLSSDRPIAILSGNSIEHLVLALAAQHVGIPYAPLATAYSLVSTDFGKLRHAVGLLTPGLVFVQDGGPYAAAVAAAVPADCERVAVDGDHAIAGSTRFADLLATVPTAAVDAAFAAVGPDTIAKILFTSGSTGVPKGVINTHRMLCANQRQIAQALPFLEDEPPVIVDWLVWNHTFGGNHNVGIVLNHGGSLYIDDGRPMPDAIGRTVANLREIAPTMYFNVPRGFEELIVYLQRERALRERFFSRLKMFMYAGAELSQRTWNLLEYLAIETIGVRVPMIVGLGCTESAPSATFAHWSGARSGLVGVPVPGLELKLVPDGDKHEARFRGPNVTPGYWREPRVTRDAFDDEGFYRTGDALRLVDPDDPAKGLAFDGRIAEDFKLATGTWVSVAPLRSALIAAAAPLVQNAVIVGPNRDVLTAIVFVDPVGCRAVTGDLPGARSLAELAADPRVRAGVLAALERLAGASRGSATRVERVVLATFAPSFDAGEITEKGTLNQRAVVRNRTALVEALYADPPPDDVIVTGAPVTS